MVEKRSLTDEQRMKIWQVIGKVMTCDDREPLKVIQEDYKGNEDVYLRTIARRHNVPLNS